MSNSRRRGLQWLGAVLGFAAAGVAIGWQVGDRRSAGPAPAETGPAGAGLAAGVMAAGVMAAEAGPASQQVALSAR